MGKVCDENCFSCRYPDCVWPDGSDQMKEKRREYLRTYRERKRAEKAAQGVTEGLGEEGGAPCGSC